jgi:hypothetical protein
MGEGGQETHDAGLVVQELVYAGLEALQGALSLDLCAYLHEAEGQGAQLFLGTPDLSAIAPADAFRLFSALRDALEDDHAGDETFLIADFLAVAVTTRGPRSRGLHVAGRAERTVDAEERDRIARMAGALGRAIHSLERLPAVGSEEPESEPLRVAVETIEGRTRAEVAAPVGDELRSGTAESSTPMRAVAAAVIDAVDGSLKLIEANDGEIGGERAVLVLMADPRERRALGAALIGERHDALSATATAALQAALRLNR